MLATEAALAERWYKVEVIAFANPDWYTDETVPGGLERVPDLYDAVALTPAPASGDEAPSELSAFQELPAAARNLNAAANRLDRSFAHQPLFYSAWVQPSYGGARARKVRLREPVRLTPQMPPSLGVDSTDVALEGEPMSLDGGGGDGAIEIESATASEEISNTEGFLRLRVGRTLNVDLDLYHQEGPVSVRLAESRRVLFNEVHYFDHPGLGVLVRVAPVELGD